MFKPKLSAEAARGYETPEQLADAIAEDILAVQNKLPVTTNSLFLYEYMDALELDEDEKEQCDKHFPPQFRYRMSESQIRQAATVIANRIFESSADGFAEELPVFKNRDRLFRLNGIAISDSYHAEMEFVKTGVREKTVKKVDFGNARECVNWIIDKHAVETDTEMEYPNSMEVNAVLIRTASGKWARVHLNAYAKYELKYVNLSLDFKQDIWHVTATYESGDGIPHVWSRNIRCPEKLLEALPGRGKFSVAKFMEADIRHKDLKRHGELLDEGIEGLIVVRNSKGEREIREDMADFNGASACNFWWKNGKWHGTKHFGFADCNGHGHRIVEFQNYDVFDTILQDAVTTRAPKK